MTTDTGVTLETKEQWSEDERRNAELVADFVRLAMVEHDFGAVRSRFGTSPYRQHSRGIPDGIDGLVDYLETLTGRFPEYTYDVKHVHVDGDHVTFQSHATLKAKHRGDDRQGLNIIDTWRIADGEIAEHWDAIQPLGLSMRLLSVFLGGRASNTNPVF